MYQSKGSSMMLHVCLLVTLETFSLKAEKISSSKPTALLTL